MYKDRITPAPADNNTIVVERYESSLYGTFGSLLYNGQFVCDTLEPRKCDNTRNSAVKDGTLSPLFIWDSERFQCKLPIFFAQGRSGLRIHAGNRVHETHGCVLVGIRDGRAVINSRRTLKSVMSLLTSKPIKYIKFIRKCSNS